jgi:hypothetical protein
VRQPSLGENSHRSADSARRQISLRSLFVAMTTLALAVGMSAWAIHDAQRRAPEFKFAAELVATVILFFIVVNLLMYFVAKLRAGKKLVPLYRRPNNCNWAAQILFLVAGSFAFYYATLQWAPHPAVAAKATALMLWICMINSCIDTLLAHPYSLHANESWHRSPWVGFSNWKGLKLSRWTRDIGGDLIIGRGPFRQVIAIPPHQRAEVDAILKEKLGEIRGLDKLVFEQAREELV